MSKLVERVQHLQKMANDGLPRLQLEVRKAEKALADAQTALSDAMETIAECDEAIPMLEDVAKSKVEPSRPGGLLP